MFLTEFYLYSFCSEVPVTEVSVVDGNTARLACDLKSSRPEDSAYLVLWYIETQKQPIYR